MRKIKVIFLFNIRSLKYKVNSIHIWSFKSMWFSTVPYWPTIYIQVHWLQPVHAWSNNDFKGLIPVHNVWILRSNSSRCNMTWYNIACLLSIFWLSSNRHWSTVSPRYCLYQFEVILVTKSLPFFPFHLFAAIVLVWRK